MITNYNPMFGSKEQCEGLVRQIKENNKKQEENKNMKEIVVIVDLESQIREKYEVFKVIMGEGTECSRDQDGASLVNEHVKVKIISSSVIRGQRGDHVLDMSKKNDKEYMEAVRKMEVTKNNHIDFDPLIKFKKLGIEPNTLNTLSALNQAKSMVASNLSYEAMEYNNLLDKAYELNNWVMANPPVK